MTHQLDDLSMLLGRLAAAQDAHLARMEALELSIRQEMGSIAERLDAGDREFGKLRALRWKGVGALGAVGLIASLAGDHFWSGVRHLLGLK